MSEDLCHLDALELGALMRQRELSAVEIAQATLDRIERLDPRLNAYTGRHCRREGCAG